MRKLNPYVRARPWGLLLAIVAFVEAGYAATLPDPLFSHALQIPPVVAGDKSSPQGTSPQDPIFDDGFEEPEFEISLDDR